MRHVFLAALLITIISSLMFSGAVNGKNNVVGDCKNSVTGDGNARNNELLAKSRARDDWRDKAGALYGAAYQLWIKSSGKQLTCSRSGGLGNRTWTCAAISQPCR